jgi:hypothetical protein
MQYVPQRGETDCVIACLAMIRGVSYEVIMDDLRMCWDSGGKEEGIDDDAFYQYLSQHGFAFQIFTHFYGPSLLHRVAWPLKPFAPVHVIGTVMDDGETHASVMDHAGRIFDPYDTQKTTLDEYAVVYEMVGIWKLHC